MEPYGACESKPTEEEQIFELLLEKVNRKIVAAQGLYADDSSAGSMEDLVCPLQDQHMDIRDAEFKDLDDDIWSQKSFSTLWRVDLGTPTFNQINLESR
jgi:hypothetical protein